MKSPLAVNVASIKGAIGNHDEVKCSAELEGLVTSGSSVPADSKVSFKGKIETIDGGIVAEGAIVAIWVGECRRCLGVANGEVNARVREIFEAKPTEGETYLLEDTQIDLEPMIRESVMLELPIAPLCKDDCAGLCPNCGINRNQASCDCVIDTGDLRWSALDQLKTAPNNELSGSE